MTHTGLPGLQAMKRMWWLCNNAASLPLHDWTLEQVMLAGVREIKPLYIPKIIDSASYKHIGNNTSTHSLQSSLSIYTQKTLSSKKSSKKFVSHKNYLIYSFLTKLKFKQDPSLQTSVYLYTPLCIPLKLRLNAVYIVKHVYKVFVTSKPCLFFQTALLIFKEEVEVEMVLNGFKRVICVPGFTLKFWRFWDSCLHIHTVWDKRKLSSKLLWTETAKLCISVKNHKRRSFHCLWVKGLEQYLGYLFSWWEELIEIIGDSCKRPSKLSYSYMPYKMSWRHRPDEEEKHFGRPCMKETAVITGYINTGSLTCQTSHNSLKSHIFTGKGLWLP